MFMAMGGIALVVEFKILQLSAIALQAVVHLLSGSNQMAVPSHHVTSKSKVQLLLENNCVQVRWKLESSSDESSGNNYNSQYSPTFASQSSPKMAALTQHRALRDIFKLISNKMPHSNWFWWATPKASQSIAQVFCYTALRNHKPADCKPTKDQLQTLQANFTSPKLPKTHRQTFPTFINW